MEVGRDRILELIDGVWGREVKVALTSNATVIN